MYEEIDLHDNIVCKMSVERSTKSFPTKVTTDKTNGMAEDKKTVEY